MAENELEGTVLGVAWDGTGYGPDGTIWGGEFLKTDAASFRRAASFRTFRLPGGASAVKEPRRTAAGMLYEIIGDRLFDRVDLPLLRSFAASERTVLRTMLARGVHSPRTSSAGRLFDAVASIIGLRQRVSFEGQAAMELEFAIGDERTEEAYEFQIVNCGLRIEEAEEIHRQSEIKNSQSAMTIDWEPMIPGILEDVRSGVPVARISAKFHNTLAEIIVDVARRVGEERVVLTGGCFQNQYLTERTVRRLETEGLRPYWHQRVPPNDGGIALGQVFAAIRESKEMKNLLSAQPLTVKAAQ
jgi:hydrogenase maturation protein HypF